MLRSIIVAGRSTGMRYEQLPLFPEYRPEPADQLIIPETTLQDDELQPIITNPQEDAPNESV